MNHNEATSCYDGRKEFEIVADRNVALNFKWIFLILNADVNIRYMLMVLCNTVTLVRCVTETCEILLCQAYLILSDAPVHQYMVIFFYNSVRTASCDHSR